MKIKLTIFLGLTLILFFGLCGCSLYYFTDRGAGSEYLQDKYHQSFIFSKNSQNGNIFFPPADEHPVMYFIDNNNNEFIVRYNKQTNEFQDNYQAYNFATEFSGKLINILGSNYKAAVNCMGIELDKENFANSLEDYLAKKKDASIAIDIYTTDNSIDIKTIANTILNNFKHNSYFITVYRLKDTTTLDKISSD